MRTAKPTRQRQEAVPLPDGLNKKLAAYALAAVSTAGLTLTIAGAPAEASIISHSTSLSLSCPTGVGNPTMAQLDLSITKSFQLDFTDRCASGPFFGSLRVAPPPMEAGSLAFSVGKWLVGSAPLAARLGKGTPIGPSGKVGFDVASGPVPVLASAGAHVSFPRGHWAPSSPSFAQTARGYLGFEFGPAGGEHFGWVAMSVVDSGWFAAHITGYAFDTVAGQTINAGQTSRVPEPATLSLLALGAAGLIALRKRKQAAGGEPVRKEQTSA